MNFIILEKLLNKPRLFRKGLVSSNMPLRVKMFLLKPYATILFAENRKRK